MKSHSIVLIILVSILGVISKDLPSTGNEDKSEESEMLANDDIIDLVFNRRGNKPCKQWKKCCKNRRDFDNNHRGLVITGGDIVQLQTSSELISFLGVCGSPNIPELPVPTAAGKNVWYKDSLFFCGGSDTYVGGETDQNNWGGAIDKCLKAKPGDTEWKSHPHFDMNYKRSWFSLNNNGNTKIVAAGGLGDDGTIWDTLEQYSKGVWKMMEHITLEYPVYGHCGVQYTLGGKSYLMLVAGSNGNWRNPTNRVTQINLHTGDAVDVNPGPLPALWAPACTIHGQDIYVTGGGIMNGNAADAADGVYKYNLNTGVFTQASGTLNSKRWGHTMGVTSKDQLVVAGGWSGDDFLTSVEVSEDGGDTWNEWSTALSGGAQYAAMAPVPNHLLKCQ